MFQDVVDSVLMLPGSSQRRAMRVSNFTRNLVFSACGQSGIPLDSTTDRFMQQVFPDLDLIRTRGLVEGSVPTAQELISEDCDIRSSGVEAQLPSRVDAMELIQPWLDLTTTAEQDLSLASLRPQMRTCMSRKSSLDVGPNVPGDFLMAANVGLSDRRGDDAEDLAAWSVIYADCSEPYFDRLGEMLDSERPAVVERNRELLEQYASELIASGYTP